MKKSALLFLIAGLFYSACTFAQCVPDTSITHNVPGIYPDSATGLPHAFVGTPYSTVIQIRVLTDTTYQGLPAIIDSIRVTGVTGMPAGFTYTCTPSNCSFPGGSNACVSIIGNAPTAGQIGVHPILVNMNIYGRVIGIPQTIQDSNDSYAIVIENNTAVLTTTPLVFGVKQNVPNPFSRFTTFNISTPSNSIISLKVTDLLGNVVIAAQKDFPRGTSAWTIDAGDLESGIYLYTVTDGKNSITRRFVVSRR